jgi:hypothetical protein
MKIRGWAGAVLAALACLGFAAAPAAAEPVLPSGFQDTVVPFEGLQAGQGGSKNRPSSGSRPTAA